MNLDWPQGAAEDEEEMDRTLQEVRAGLRAAGEDHPTTKARGCAIWNRRSRVPKHGVACTPDSIC